MFQADEALSTIASNSSFGPTSSPDKTLRYGITRSQVMKRAWQLAALNNPVHKHKRRAQLGQWMKMAWAEARRGDTERWSFLSPEQEARALERQLVTLEYADRHTEAHYTLMDLLRASITELRAGAL